MDRKQQATFTNEILKLKTTQKSFIVKSHTSVSVQIVQITIQKVIWTEVYIMNNKWIWCIQKHKKWI